MSSLHSADSPTGLDLIRREQARQVGDAQRTWQDEGQRRQAERLAAALRRSGASLLLLGMGASHHANTAALAAYRELDVAATAMSLDEALSMPLPPDPARVTFVVSQSGESGEIQTFLDAAKPDLGMTFGLSLSPEGVLARSLPSLVAVGGPEVGFAATRSYLLTLVLHGLVLRACASKDQEPAQATLPGLNAESVDVARFSEVRSMVFAGSGGLAGLAAMTALGSIELGRFPALHYDLGQLRHGPLELLSPESGVILLRRHEEGAYERRTAEAILQACRVAGSPALSLMAPQAPAGVLWLLAAPLTLCLPVQQVVIDLAAQRVERVGEPLRSSKVTR